MPIDEFKQWIVEQEIEKRTLQGFWLNLNNYQTEDPDEFNYFFKNFNRDNLDVTITQIALMLGNYPECNYTTNFFGESAEQLSVFPFMPAVSIYFADPDGHSVELLAMLEDEPRADLEIMSWQEWETLHGRE